MWDSPLGTQANPCELPLPAPGAHAPGLAALASIHAVASSLEPIQFLERAPSRANFQHCTLRARGHRVWSVAAGTGRYICGVKVTNRWVQTNCSSFSRAEQAASV